MRKVAPLKTGLALVTGATGLVGSHLVERLLAAGVRVRACVRPSSEMRYLDPLPVEIVRGESADPVVIQQAVAGAQWVFHAAAALNLGSTFAGDATTDEYTATNVDLSAALLAASLAAGVERFVYVSSASVYSLGAPNPITETAPLVPYSPYGRSKLRAEELVRSYQQDQGLATTIVRPALIYGPRDRYFIPTALRLARLPVLPLVNGGRHIVDFVYAGDVAELLWQASQSDAAIGKEYNAGPGVPTSLLDLATVYRQLTGRAPRILPVSSAAARRFAPLARRYLARFAPGVEVLLTPVSLALMDRDIHLDMTRARTELGYTPRVDLKEGLALSLGLSGN